MRALKQFLPFGNYFVISRSLKSEAVMKGPFISFIHHLFLTSAITLLSIQISEAQSTESCTFLEKDGIVTIEMESADLSNTYWIKRTDIPGYTGSGYLEYTGGTMTGIVGHSLLTYKIHITEPGRYSFKGRSFGLGHAANDIWARFPHGGVVTMYNGDSTGTKNDEWFKFMVGAQDQWYYFMKTQNHETGETLQDVYVDFPEAGEYMVEFSGRATDFKIDRFTLFNTSGFYGMNLENPESDRINCVNTETTTPVVTGTIPDQELKPGQTYSYIIPETVFDHPQGKDMTYFAAVKGEPLPEWLTFDHQTKTLSGAASTADEDLYYVVIKAQDANGNYAVTGFELLVTSNEAPVLSDGALEDQITYAGDSFKYSIPPHTFQDPNDDSIIYTASGQDGAPLPGWLLFNNETAEFTGVPEFNEIGEYFIVLEANDGKNGTTTGSFTIVVDQALFTSAETRMELKVFPNPAKDLIRVDYELDENVQTVIYDQKGKIIFRKTLKGALSENVIHLSGTDIPSGLYFIHITGVHSGKSFSTPFYKQ